MPSKSTTKPTTKSTSTKSTPTKSTPTKPTTKPTVPKEKIVVKKELDNTEVNTNNKINNKNNKTKNNTTTTTKSVTPTTTTTLTNNKKRKAEEQSSPSSSKKPKTSNKTKPTTKEENEDDDLAVSSSDEDDVAKDMDVEGKEEDDTMKDENHIPLVSATSSSSSSSSKKKNQQSKVVCLSRLPFGMEEDQLRDFLAQFGKTEKIRVSRNRITGKSRGYAFVMFEQPIVAQIVCDTLHDYFFGIRRLHCRIVPSEKIHADLFKPIPIFKEHPHDIVKRSFNSKMNDTSEKAVKNRQRNLLSKQKKLAKRLSASNISYTAPGSVQIPKRKRLPTLKQMKRRPALKYNLTKERALLALSGKPYFSLEKK